MGDLTGVGCSQAWWWVRVVVGLAFGGLPATGRAARLPTPAAKGQECLNGGRRVGVPPAGGLYGGGYGYGTAQPKVRAANHPRVISKVWNVCDGDKPVRSRWMNLAMLLTLLENKYVHQSITGHKEPRIHSSLAVFWQRKASRFAAWCLSPWCTQPSRQPLTLHCGWPEQWTSSTAWSHLVLEIINKFTCGDWLKLCVSLCRTNPNKI